MSSIRLTVTMCALIAVSATTTHAQSTAHHVDGDILPVSIRTYETSESLTRSGSFSFEASELVAHARSYEQAGSGNGASLNYWPVLYSAIIPGTGEMALGHWVRGSVMLALEIIAWTGYAKYDGDGLDVRDQYESFADVNWKERKWIDDHPEVFPTFSNAGWTPVQMDSIGRVVSGSGTWPGYIPWVSKEEDKQHYYENIGKYDWYMSGWADYSPTNPDQQGDGSTTVLREEYRSMRHESDENFSTAKRFVYVSVVTRVVSVLQTVYLVRKHASNEVEESRVGIRARAYGLSGGEVAMEYRF